MPDVFVVTASQLTDSFPSDSADGALLIIGPNPTLAGGRGNLQQVAQATITDLSTRGVEEFLTTLIMPVDAAVNPAINLDDDQWEVVAAQVEEAQANNPVGLFQFTAPSPRAVSGDFTITVTRRDRGEDVIPLYLLLQLVGYSSYEPNTIDIGIFDPPYTIEVNSTTLGLSNASYFLVAEYVENRQRSGRRAALTVISVTTGEPTVAIISPATNAILTMPFTIEAVPEPVAPATISRVTFYFRQRVMTGPAGRYGPLHLLGSDTSNPYTITVDPANLPEGDYFFRAVATDSNGRDSAPFEKFVTINPSPTPGVICADATLLTAEIQYGPYTNTATNHWFRLPHAGGNYKIVLVVSSNTASGSGAFLIAGVGTACGAANDGQITQSIVGTGTICHSATAAANTLFFQVAVDEGALSYYVAYHTGTCA